MIIFLQLIAIFFALIMIYFAVLHYQRKELEKTEIVSWVAVWIGVMLAALFPDIISQFSRQVLVTRLFDLMVVGGFVLVITMSTRSYLKTKKMEKKLEEYVRKEALKNVKKAS
jgi:hypothetical protein